MKKIILICLCIAGLFISAHAQQKPPRKPYTISVGIGRTARITDWKISRSEINFSATLSYRLSKRVSAAATIIKTAGSNSTVLRFAINCRVISF